MFANFAAVCSQLSDFSLYSSAEIIFRLNFSVGRTLYVSTSSVKTFRSRDLTQNITTQQNFPSLDEINFTKRWRRSVTYRAIKNNFFLKSFYKILPWLHDRGLTGKKFCGNKISGSDWRNFDFGNQENGWFSSSFLWLFYRFPEKVIIILGDFWFN